jgi:MFS family permease
VDVTRQRATSFFLSCLLSYTGGHMVNYSVIIYAQDVLGSDLLSGIGFALCFGPPLVLGWWAGVLCDRMSPVRLIHLAQLALLASALVLVAGHVGASSAGWRTVCLLLAALLAGVSWSFVAPARMTALAQVLAPAQLPRGALLLNLLVMTGFGLGPLGISVLRVGGGWEAVLAVAAGLFVVSSVLLWPVVGVASHKVHRPVVEEVKEGLDAVRASPLLSQLLLAAMFAYTMMGPMQVMLPKFARHELALSELARGSFLGALAPALIAGGVLAMLLARRLAHGPVILAATAVGGLSFAVLGGSTSALAATVCLSVAGVSGGAAISLMVAGIQSQAPALLRGRVLAMYTVASQVVPAASGLVAGVLVHRLGASMAIIAAGTVISLASFLNVAWMRALRAYPGSLPSTV